MKQKPTSRRKRTQRLENGAVYEAIPEDKTPPDRSPAPTRPTHSTHAPTTRPAVSKSPPSSPQHQQKRRNPPRQLTPAEQEARKCKQLVDQTHPVLLPSGIRRTFYVDCPSYTPTASAYLDEQDLKDLFYTAFNSVTSSFAYKEQYYEITYGLQHGGLSEKSMANYLLHLHKNLDDSVTTFYPHTHLFPFDETDIPPSITTAVSAYQLSRGTAPDVVVAGSIPRLDEDLLLEEMLLTTVYFDDIRQLETVVALNRRFMNADVSDVLQRKKDEFAELLVSAFANNAARYLAKKKGLVFAERLFALISSAQKGRVVMAVIAAVAELADTQDALAEERSRFLSAVGTYLRELTDVVEICEYVGEVCERLAAGAEFFRPSVSMLVRGLVENTTLREEEAGTHDEFVETCLELAPDNPQLVDPQLMALLRPKR